MALCGMCRIDYHLAVAVGGPVFPVLSTSTFGPCEWCLQWTVPHSALSVPEQPNTNGAKSAK